MKKFKRKISLFLHQMIVQNKIEKTHSKSFNEFLAKYNMYQVKPPKKQKIFLFCYSYTPPYKGITGILCPIGVKIIRILQELICLNFL